MKRRGSKGAAAAKAARTRSSSRRLGKVRANRARRTREQA